MAIKTKICGLTSKESIKSAIENGADYVGFVFFHKSPRVITARNAAKLAAVLPDNIKTVAVVVDITDAELEDILSYFKPDFIQCHGKETTERIIEIREKFGIKVIKAISVRSSDDIAKGKSFSDIADMILFDAKVPSSPLPGGNGLAFDWTLL
ncbi:MAG: N-(5-phosphoribosyl)anthranilate isomerase, partial [Burkholderiales bacterium]|nr:N-(5-phosphoribosyl)anthranilate isomerase [Burkholderiales bacterium]